MNSKELEVRIALVCEYYSMPLEKVKALSLTEFLELFNAIGDNDD